MKSIFDEIGYWSEVKLDIIKLYASKYSLILTKQKYPPLYHIYIDAFAGSGKHISKRTGEFVPGSPKIALDIEPPFKEYYFIDIDGNKVAELSDLVSSRPEAHVLCGDCNSRLITDIFPKVRWEQFRRGLCILDPYGLDLCWEVIETAGRMKSIDIFLNFPVMDMNRNVLWNNPEIVDATDVLRMNRFWGDESWRRTSYRQITNLFGEVCEIKESNERIANAFRERLKTAARFMYVPYPIPRRNSKGAIVYYLFFASQNKVAEEIITYIFRKYRNRGV